ncbi:signal peptidase I [Mucilaginibacter sp. FT3.2]|uniref:signal peptidase I n=1 Tax=Mucilaginibacter sp. FT3.2 TaxID=2723090 RepID=UPI00161787C7|nr:signal peptidase I [Mucilaginibacter sp. FT3.2]MBB6232789.1 signal peptidase I [Mucilaginibacter sp. FT3.2]
MNKRTIKKYLKKHRYKLPAIFFCSLFLFFAGLPWLSLGIIILTAVYFIFTSIKVISNNYFISLPLMLLAIISLAVLIRLFIFEVYNVPSESMEDALFPGDYIIVSKLNYGPKTPQSPFEIPWINLLFYLNKNASAKSNSTWWAYKRLGGFTKVKQGDIVVFKSITDGKEILVKRCIGLPGNRLQIINGTVVVNNQLIKTSPTVKHLYKVWLSDVKQFASFADSLYIPYNVKHSTGKQYYSDILLNSNEKALVENLKGNDSVIYKSVKGSAFSGNPQINWSPDNLGPVIIPAKGMKIQLNQRNCILYGQILKNEQTDLYNKNGNYYFNGKLISQYTFKKNYYFMMGDNRNYSYDSRFWGFVPEDYIIGKAILKVFPFGVSKDKRIKKTSTLFKTTNYL